MNQRNFKGRKRKDSRKGFRKGAPQFDSIPVSIRRVTKVGSGSKRLRFSVVVVIGDRKGQVGAGLGRGPDVRSSIEKATRAAKKAMFRVPMVGSTIPHEITCKRGAAKIFLKPALPGTGVIAGGAVRAVVELAGIKDLLSKVQGTNNKINNVYTTIEALKQLSNARADGSWRLKPMVSKIKIHTLAEMDKKAIKKERAKKVIKKPAKKKTVKPVKKAEKPTKKVAPKAKEKKTENNGKEKVVKSKEVKVKSKSNKSKIVKPEKKIK